MHRGEMSRNESQIRLSCGLEARRRASISIAEAFTDVRKRSIMKKLFQRLWKDIRGQDLVEYALAAGMVAVAAVAAMPALSATVNNVFNKIASIIEAQVK